MQDTETRGGRRLVRPSRTNSDSETQQDEMRRRFHYCCLSCIDNARIGSGEWAVGEERGVRVGSGE